MTQILREPDPTATAIRNYLWNNDELLKGSYKDYIQHPLGGACYVATESYYHTRDNRDEWTPQCLVVEWNEDGYHRDLSHWYLLHEPTHRIVDLTADQFDVVDAAPTYGGGIGRGFVPPSPSERAENVLNGIEV